MVIYNPYKQLKIVIGQLTIRFASLLLRCVLCWLVSWIYTIDRYDTFKRSGGVFGDLKFAALQLIIGLPFIIEFWQENKRIGKVWLGVAGFSILLAFSYTVSIGGLIGIASMLLVKTLLVHQRNIFLILARSILTCLIVFWLAYYFLPSYYLE